MRYFTLALVFICLSFLSSCTSQKTTLPEPDRSPADSRAKDCSEEAKAEVKAVDTQSISISVSGEEVSDWVKEGEYSGFFFEAQAGQSFSINTKQEICISLFKPDKSLLKTIAALEAEIKLPENGQYLIQVSPLKKTTVFTLVMELDPGPGGNITSKSTLRPSKPSSPSAKAPSTTTKFDGETISKHVRQSQVWFTPKRGETITGDIDEAFERLRDNPSKSGVIVRISWNDGEKSNMLFQKTLRVYVWHKAEKSGGRWYWSADKKTLFVEMDAGSEYEFKS